MKNIEHYKIKLDDAFLNTMKEKHWADESIKEPDYFRRLFKIPEDVFEEYYHAARKILEEKNYTDSLDAFLFLSFLNPYLHNVWMGIGISQQCLGKYEEALNAYFMAEATDPKDPTAHANAFQCFSALDHHEEALASLKMAIECCGDIPEYAELKEILLPLKNSFKKAA